VFGNRNQEKISTRESIEKASNAHYGIHCTGLSGSARAHFIAALYLKTRKPLLVVLPDTEDGKQFVEDIEFFLPDTLPPVIYVPPYNISPYKSLSYHNETAAKRIGALHTLVENRSPLVVVPIGVLLQKIIPKRILCNYAELIMDGEEIDRDALIEKLISGGYTRTSIVEEPGDFSVRGGILDIYPPLYDEPLRIEQFGDLIESLRSFSPVNQRTTGQLNEAVILPARETVLEKESIDNISQRIRSQASKRDVPVSAVRETIARLQKEILLAGSESLIALIYAKLDTIFDYLPENPTVIQVEPEQLKSNAAEIEKRTLQDFNTACEEQRLCAAPPELYLKWNVVESLLLAGKTVSLQSLPVISRIDKVKGKREQVHLLVEDNSDVTIALKNYRGNENPLSPAVAWFRDKIQSGIDTVLVCQHKSQAERLSALLKPYGLQTVFIDRFTDIDSDVRNHVLITFKPISSGFVCPDESFAIITAREIFGERFRHGKRRRKKRETGLQTFEDLRKGDLVVHEDHGIGCYQGLQKLNVGSAENDFLLITYRDDDKLYLPVDRMNVLKKYMGVDGIRPVLDKMGGKSWERIKTKIKRSAEKIAGELLKIYAERKIKKGFAARPLGPRYNAFEKDFSYAETPDQLKVIEEVLHDMMTPVPMDRLVCGDVGYGKTEVALRASFLAVNNGKQVAILVPTTVLAEQHYETFTRRFNKFAIHVSSLSRFRNLREQRDTMRNLKSGKVDIVIGTHRLLSKDVFFSDLGLLIIDEEQRFGVKHKEKMKQLRRTVDVLALTATPIPRTLHMSLSGIRDISIISTPPEYRQAIITFISQLDEAVISEAIRKELSRRGQIFFIHNNIKSIKKMARRLEQLVPEVRLAVAHGRQDEDELEKTMLAFMQKEIDMLVCTTIVESGLDIPSANTIMVNRADKFGLAQIYQLRGRVGRSSEQAYAYLFIPNESVLTENARKRLKVLMEYSDLGSGFQIAMSDLKIRGGGTLLGASQSGHIAAVGYEMYLQLMEDAIAELKGEPHREKLNPEINIQLSAFIPPSYISDLDQRLSAYRRLTKMKNLDEIVDYKKELIDRYGRLPEEAINLLSKTILKVLAAHAGIARLDLIDYRLSMTFSESHVTNAGGIVNLIKAHSNRYTFSPGQVLKITVPKAMKKGLFFEVKNILKEIAQYVNC